MSKVWLSWLRAEVPGRQCALRHGFGDAAREAAIEALAEVIRDAQLDLREEPFYAEEIGAGARNIAPARARDGHHPRMALAAIWRLEGLAGGSHRLPPPVHGLPGSAAAFGPPDCADPHLVGCVAVGGWLCEYGC